jgi:hypothetical protein
VQRRFAAQNFIENAVSKPYAIPSKPDSTGDSKRLSREPDSGTVLVNDGPSS